MISVNGSEGTSGEDPICCILTECIVSWFYSSFNEKLDRNDYSHIHVFDT